MSRSRNGGGRPRSTRSYRKRRVQLSAPLWLEHLERRVLLSVDTWNGSAGDNLWSDPANWSEDAVPGPSDDVSIPGGFPTIEYDSSAGTTTIDSLTDQ
ncbi:MAG: hypothetical protein ACLQVF_43770, partial [Isosphaeraceae bacterium]